ncbi:carboxypeptidase B2 isoform X1 [Stegostoma tigrinum]|uniref:carboxypeptidase B2 isoform X1 n=1 Tax=Stegostoma tigrinum TaxID=3053191 RepID=UPI00202AC7EC|nr:carboxypeptidase B2 isoform X1 [Stegostoma tigrinum]
MGFHILAYLLCTFTGIIVASSPRHARDQVLSVKLQSDKEIRFIKQIFNQYEAVLWHPSSVDNIKINKEIHLYFNASNVEEVKTQLTASTIAFRVLIEDVQQLITKQKLTNVPFTPRGFSSYYEMYHPLEEIYLWMSQITKAYPSLIQKILIGSSAEKRLIYVLKVFNGTVSPKGALWIDCGIHAREWIAPAFCQWFLQYLVDTKNPIINNILKSFEIYVLPVWNVDGYKYTWTTDRFWRKNLSKHNGGHCVGTDLNRNWDANWCGSGASSDPCSETYCGRYPESEPEVKAVAAFIRKRSDHIMSYISIHSYSQMVMFPYSYKLSRSKDHDELNYVAWKAVTAVRSVHGTSYSYGNSAKTIYLSSGCSDDWAYDLGIKYSFTFELRDTGTYGFLLPPSFIKPTCEEATAAVSEILHHIVQRI